MSDVKVTLRLEDDVAEWLEKKATVQGISVSQFIHEMFWEKMMGIIDQQRNPFATESWIKQRYPLTRHRRDQLEEINGMTIAEIRSLDRNKGSYPVFVGIRWGAAKIIGGRLRIIKS